MTRGSSGSGPRSSPTTSPTTRPGSRKRSGGCRSPGSSTGASTATSSPLPAPTARAPTRSPPGRRCAPARSASKSSGRRPSCLAEDPPDTDPNLLALVIRARWHDFTMLLTADAEAESTPLDPGPIDVLKVAHHGCDDAGPRAAARPHPAAPRGDLGRRRQPLRPPDPRHARDPRRAPRPDPADRPRRHGRDRRSPPDLLRRLDTDARRDAPALPDLRHRRGENRGDPVAPARPRRTGGGRRGARGLRAERGPRRARPRGAAGGDPGDVADGHAPLPARRRGREMARQTAGRGRRGDRRRTAARPHPGPDRPRQSARPNC